MQGQASSHKATTREAQCMVVSTRSIVSDLSHEFRLSSCPSPVAWICGIIQHFLKKMAPHEGNLLLDETLIADDIVLPLPSNPVEPHTESAASLLHITLNLQDQIAALQKQQAFILHRLGANAALLQKTRFGKYKARTVLNEATRMELKRVFDLEQYPDAEERERLCHCSGLTLKQINNWFCNRRKRTKCKMSCVK